MLADYPGIEPQYRNSTTVGFAVKAVYETWKFKKSTIFRDSRVLRSVRAWGGPGKGANDLEPRKCGSKDQNTCKHVHPCMLSTESDDGMQAIDTRGVCGRVAVAVFSGRKEAN